MRYENWSSDAFSGTKIGASLLTPLCSVNIYDTLMHFSATDKTIQHLINRSEFIKPIAMSTYLLFAGCALFLKSRVHYAITCFKTCWCHYVVKITKRRADEAPKMTPKAANGTPFSGHPSLLSDKCWGSMPALAEKCGGEFTPTAAMLFRLNPCFRVGGFFLGRNLSDTPKSATH